MIAAAELAAAPDDREAAALTRAEAEFGRRRRLAHGARPGMPFGGRVLAAVPAAPPQVEPADDPAPGPEPAPEPPPPAADEPRRRGPKRKTKLEGPSMRRFDAKERKTGHSDLPFDHPALAEARTRFAARVVDPLGEGRILKSGHNNKKIGSRVARGRWAGMPIWTLTLEERATCPERCQHWSDCYGNKMHWPRRHAPGPALELRLEMELAELQARWPEGFVVRLHILGDFYSVAYAYRWAEWLAKFPGLHVYGYTARSPVGEIGRVLDWISRHRWDRFAMRFSGWPGHERCAVTVRDADAAPEGAIVCPAQVERAACCATCGACWERRAKNIAFIEH